MPIKNATNAQLGIRICMGAPKCRKAATGEQKGPVFGTRIANKNRETLN